MTHNHDVNVCITHLVNDLAVACPAFQLNEGEVPRYISIRGVGAWMQAGKAGAWRGSQQC